MSDTAHICDFAGHDWSDAGGGLEICTECQAERWAPREDDCLCAECEAESAGHRRPA